MSRRSPTFDRAAGRRCLAALVRDNALTGTAFLDAYRQLRTHYALGDDAHDARAIAEAAALVADHRTIGYDVVRQLLGGGWAVSSAGYRAVLDRLGRAGQPRAPRAAPEAIERFRAFLDANCGPLPETCFSPPPRLPLRPPAPTLCARVLALADPAIRLSGAIDLALCAASRLTSLSRFVKGWERLDGLVSEGIDDLPWPSRAATTALVERWILAEPTNRTLTFCKQLAASSNRLRIYLEKYPEVVARMTHAVVPVCNPANHHVRELRAAHLAQREARRRGTADPLADDWEALLTLAGHRVDQLDEIRAAFDQACQAIGDRNRQPVRFALTLQPWLDATGSAPPVTLDFRVWPAERLRRHLERPHQTKEARKHQHRRFFLEFIGPRAPASLDDVPPLLRGYSIGLFNQLAALDPERQAAVRAFNTATGWQPRIEMLGLFRYEAPRDRRWADQALRRGIVLVPIEMAHYGITVGHALLRSGFITGARIGESLQHAASARCFQTDVDGNLWFEAEAKSHSLPTGMSFPRERYYCDEGTLAAVHSVITVIERNGWTLGPIAPPYAVRERCPADRYLYRLQGRVISQSEANAGLRVLLLGRRLSGHDLRHAFGKKARRVAPLRDVQAAMHHGDPQHTQYYSRSTPRAQAELARRLAERAAPRALPGEGQ